ncbi:MAG: bifunctional folylpolyglutamate synthase/dihydrofolate synthase [Ktedonobacteraceae bacterium]|nr:bifunctional folylpolyglutamate synthase/dihydrofolate synthase [Ktedonobacteraceae bacterium]
MNYREAMAYLYSFSDFERSGSYSRNLNENLPREARLLELLGKPQQRYSSTHIAGTKGKGSTAAFIECVLRQAGYTTGLYTQPHLHTFRERIRVNGRLISEGEVAQLLAEIRTVVEEIQERREFGPFITYEVATALAFLYFARQQVQHAVVEVGLGGRLDATSVLSPLVSVITSISYDHMAILGNTLTQIATEKAGIIKPRGIVVTSAQAPEALLAIAAAAQKQQAQLLRIGSASIDPAQSEVDAGKLPALSYRYQLERQHDERQRFTVWTPTRRYSGLEIPLLGQHQLENATAALATLDVLRVEGLDWSEHALREGFSAIRWPARIEVIGHNPTLVVDGAHNPDSLEKLLATLRTSFTPHRLVVVLSVTRDKDLTGMVQALSDVDEVILTRMANPRAASIETLQTLFAQHAPHVLLHIVNESWQAMDLALDVAQSNDLVCATGSLYLAGEALRWATAHGYEAAAGTIESVDH